MDRKTNELPDGLEFAVSQDVDGVLADFDRRNLGDRLTSDAARRWADEDRRLNALLRDHDPLPAVDFTAFHARFAAALADEPPPAAADDRGPVRLPTAWWRRMSIAAGLALAATLAWHYVDRPTAGRPAPAGQAIVQGPATTMPVGSVTVAVGPSDELKRRGLAMGLGTDPVPQQATKVVITSVEPPAKDGKSY